MKCSPLAYVLFLAIYAASVSTAQAQVGTGGGATGGTTTTGTGQTATGATSVTGISADAAFLGIQRGETVGSSVTADGSVGVGGATNTGGGGLGGFGGGFGGLGGLGGFGGLNSLFGGAAGSQTTQPAIRTRLRSAIQVAPTPPQQVQQIAIGRLQALPPSRQMNGVNVIMDGRTAIVSGVVNSEHDRRMSELLMRLEPGVSRVENRVMISP